MQHTYGRMGASLRRLTPRHALLLGIERRIFSDAAQLVQCGSGMVRDEIAARFGVSPTRLHVIHNGVDFAKFRPGEAAHRERATHASLPRTSAPVWLFAGSGWRRKGLDTAMRALAASEHEESRLWVAGADPPSRWRRLARRLGIGARVDFLGSRVDLECVYRAADALLLPSRYDAFANVCLEAAASGLPVVTCRSNGSSELFANAGIVLDDAEDACGFAQALDRLTDASLREELAAKARALTLELSWDRHVEQLRALYARVRS
jgi:UDP-glucose:(heptosyl)LPS alpha-1,3-glucosyltransferase